MFAHLAAVAMLAALAATPQVAGSANAATATRRAAAAATAPHPHAIEQAIEVVMSAVRLPDGPAGFLLVTACDGCAPVSFGVDARSIFVLDHKELPLATLRLRLRPGATYAATVIYASADKRVTRLLVTSR